MSKNEEMRQRGTSDSSVSKRSSGEPQQDQIDSDDLPFSRKAVDRRKVVSELISLTIDRKSLPQPRTGTTIRTEYSLAEEDGEKDTSCALRTKFRHVAEAEQFWMLDPHDFVPGLKGVNLQPRAV